MISLPPVLIVTSMQRPNIPFPITHATEKINRKFPVLTLCSLLGAAKFLCPPEGVQDISVKMGALYSKNLHSQELKDAMDQDHTLCSNTSLIFLRTGIRFCQSKKGQDK